MSLASSKPRKKSTVATKLGGKQEAGIYISQNGLKELSKYKYSGGGYTPLDNVLNPFWVWGANFFPLWFAPNLITFIGLLFAMIPYFLFAYYQGTDTWGAQTDQDQPWWRWVNLFSAFALFVYQTMDAMDGKQARRTGSASPLGQLFDHGCDALVTVFSTAVVCSAARFPEKWQPLAFTFSVQLPFFLAQWEEMHCHEFRSGIGFLGVTEAQFTVMALNIFVAFYGNNVMQETLFNVPFLGDITLATGCLYTQLFIGSMMTLEFLRNTFVKCVNKRQAFQQLIPINVLAIFSVLLLKTEAYEQEPRLIIFLVGLVFAYITSNMIVVSVCKMEFPVRRNLMLVCGIPIIYYYPKLILPFECFAVTTYLHFHSCVIHEITRYLNIKCFSIPYKKA